VTRDAAIYNRGMTAGSDPTLLPFPVLLDRMRAGDGEAWQEFHARYEPFLRQLARRWLDPGLRVQADSCDVAQSVLRVLLESDGRVAFQDEARLRGWLAAVTRSRISRLTRRVRGPGGGRWTGPPDEEQDASADDDPAVLAQRAEAIHRLKSAMDRLTHDERQVLVLREFEGLSFADVAARLGRPTADAARKAFDRACVRLDALLRESMSSRGPDAS
jgi:RNA polymerase sigma-70 factor (ECF subfamily)